MNPKGHVLSGVSVLLAYSMLDTVMEDLQDNFGKAFLYHPFSIWLCIVMLVHTQTGNFRAGISVVLLYEIAKYLWKTIQPEPPMLGKLKKLLHRIQNGEKLSDADISFLNNITPEDVNVTRKTKM